MAKVAQMGEQRDLENCGAGAAGARGAGKRSAENPPGSCEAEVRKQARPMKAIKDMHPREKRTAAVAMMQTLEDCGYSELNEVIRKHLAGEVAAMVKPSLQDGRRCSTIEGTKNVVEDPYDDVANYDPRRTMVNGIPSTVWGFYKDAEWNGMYLNYVSRGGDLYPRPGDNQGIWVDENSFRWLHWYTPTYRLSPVHGADLNLIVGYYSDRCQVEGPWALFRDPEALVHEGEWRTFYKMVNFYKQYTAFSLAKLLHKAATYRAEISWGRLPHLK